MDKRLLHKVNLDDNIDLLRLLSNYTERKMIVRMHETVDKVEEFDLDNHVAVLWIDCGCDSVFAFWLLVRRNKIPDGCVIVFTDADNKPCWCDLRNTYGGTSIGRLFLMAFKHGPVTLVPSQRGIFRGDGNNAKV
jgi:hypothetical protein